MCSLLSFSDMSKHSLVSSFVLVVVGFGEGRWGGVGFFFLFFFFGGFFVVVVVVGWKICNVNVL